MNELYRLVYTSRNLLVGDEDARVSAVAEILARSQANNARVGVTGALLFNGGYFAQVLEGPRVAVEATFERIQRDPRHSDVAVLQCEPVEERGFPHWSMSFIGHSPRGRALWAEIAGRTGFDLGRIDGDALFATLHAIVLEEEGVEPQRGEPAVIAAPWRGPERPEPRPSTPRGASDRGDPERVEGLDVARLRAELGVLAEQVAAEQTGASGPARAALPAPPPVAAPAVEDKAVAVLRAALDAERARTTALRRDLDEARIALAVASDRGEAQARRAEIWAERARALATALCREPEAAQAEPTLPVRRSA